MRVDVSAKQLKMPSQCACCGGTADTAVSSSFTRVHGTRVVRTKTSSWGFPFCPVCVRSDDEWPNASPLGALLLILLTCGLYLIYYVRQRRKALALCTSTCAPPRRAVQYLGWHGTVHHFNLASPVFTKEFLTANK